jgi:hypothetical protein
LEWLSAVGWEGKSMLLVVGWLLLDDQQQLL